MNQERLEKVFKIKERILSGVESLDSMRFIVGRFTSFSPEIEFLPRSFGLFYLTEPSIHATFYIDNGEVLGAEKLAGR